MARLLARAEPNRILTKTNSGGRFQQIYGAAVAALSGGSQAEALDRTLCERLRRWRAAGDGERRVAPAREETAVWRELGC